MHKVSISRTPIIILVLNITIGLVYILFILNSWLDHTVLFHDFSVYYSEGLIIRDGHPNQIYDIDIERSYQSSIFAGNQIKGGILPFVYPPHVALIFVPFALFSRQTAIIIWLIIQILLLIYMFRLLNRMTPNWSHLEHWLMWSSITAFLPLLITIISGAYSLIIMVCLLQIYIHLRNHRDALTGFWFCIGLIKPQFMILPGLMFFALRRWRAIFVIGIGAFFIFLTSSILLGWNIWLKYLELFSSLTTYFDSFGFFPTTMFNIRGLLSLLLGNNHLTIINLFSYGAFLAATGITILIWIKPCSYDNPSFKLRFAITILIGILFNLHLYQYDALLLVIPVVLLYDYLKQKNFISKYQSAGFLCFPHIYILFRIIIKGDWFILFPIVSMVCLLVIFGRTLYYENRITQNIINVNVIHNPMTE